LQFAQRFLDDLAKMATFAGVNHDLAQDLHGRSLAGLMMGGKHLGTSI
jgi:hypothetical protein